MQLKLMSMQFQTGKCFYSKYNGAHEEAGIHSGDSACSLPPYSLDEKTIE